MLVVGILAILTLLVLFQINVLPLNLAFAVILAFFLFSRRDFSFWWIFVLALLVSLLANLNLGLVLLAFTATFLLSDLLSRLFPDNRIVKGTIIVLALVVCEFALINIGAVLT